MARALNGAKATRSLAEYGEQQRRNELADLRALMDTQEGRRTVWRFLERACVFGSAFNTNAMTQSHTIGWQDAGKWWLAEIEAACPEKFAVMQNEARKAAKQVATELKQLEEQDDER